MSACLFMIDTSNLTEFELYKLRDELLFNGELCTRPDPKSRFECDRWSGREHTLRMIYYRLIELERAREDYRNFP